MSTQKTGAKHAPSKTAWKPGQSGNPKGRPTKGNEIRAILRRKLTDIATIDGKKITRGERIADVWLEAAEGGNPYVIEKIINNAEGELEKNINVKDTTVDPFDGLTSEEIKKRLPENER